MLEREYVETKPQVKPSATVHFSSIFAKRHTASERPRRDEHRDDSELADQQARAGRIRYRFLGVRGPAAAALELEFLVELPRALDHLAVLVGPLALDRVDDRGLLLGVRQADAKHLAVAALRAQSGHDLCRGAGRLRRRREQAHGLLQIVSSEAAQIAPRIDAECRGPAGRSGDGDQQPVAGHAVTIIPDALALFTSGRIMRFMPSATRASSRADRASAVAVHAEPPAAVWERTGSRPGGLRPEEVAQRRKVTARTERGSTSAVVGEIVESVVEPLQLLLVVVGVLSAIFGELRDAIAIFSIIVLVSAVEAISEVRAKRALQALRELSAPNALVRRAGVAVAVPVGALVVGDVLLVEAGSVVAADARVVEADGLATDESRLTGEPMAAAKGPEPVDADAPLAERSSVLHAGTAVVAGAGEGVVVALGDETEIGRLGRLVAQAKEPPTPLQGAMAELARAALIVAVTACVLVPLARGPSGPAPARDAARRADARVRHDPRGAADPRDGARRARRSAPGAARRPAAAAARRRGRRRDDRAARRQDRDADREPAADRTHRRRP